MTLKEFIQYTNYSTVRPRIYCSYGFNVSVQASKTNWCHPQIDQAEEYTHYEVGFPSISKNELIPYEACDDVYAMVPAVIIRHIIKSHGGIDRVKTLNGYNRAQAKKNYELCEEIMSKLYGV